MEMGVGLLWASFWLWSVQGRNRRWPFLDQKLHRFLHLPLLLTQCPLYSACVVSRCLPLLSCCCCLLWTILSFFLSLKCGKKKKKKCQDQLVACLASCKKISIKLWRRSVDVVVCVAVVVFVGAEWEEMNGNECFEALLFVLFNGVLLLIVMMNDNSNNNNNKMDDL